MNEDKVRAAAKVATELARDVPEHTYRDVWQSVFHALLSEPWDNRTAATVTKYKIGPLTVENDRLSLDVGNYKVTKPLSFIGDAETLAQVLIEGVVYQPFGEGDSNESETT